MNLFSLKIWFLTILLWPYLSYALKVEPIINTPDAPSNYHGFLVSKPQAFNLNIPIIDAEIPPSDGGPTQTGIVYILPTPVNSNQLNWTSAGGGNVAYIHVQTPQAQRLRLQLSIISPTNAISLHVKGNLDSIPLGSISPNNQQTETLWLPVTNGNSTDLEIFVNSDVNPDSINFTLTALNYIIADTTNNSNKAIPYALGLAEATEYDLTCWNSNSNYSGLALAAAATAKVNFIKNKSSYICSGTLLNDYNGTNTPWFATANHCLTDQTIASTASFEWFFQATNCGSSQRDSRYSQTTGGATLLWTNFNLEVAFLKLNNPPGKNTVFSGWNTDLKINEEIWGVHHPHGDQTMVSQGYVSNLLVTIDDISQGGTHLLNRVEYVSGGIEPGSSGSGLFSITANGNTPYWQGTLFGSSDNNYQSASYSNFGSYFSNLQAWLYPPKPNVTFSATPTIIATGAQSTLTWTSKNATSCTASGGWSGNKNTSGTQPTGALSTNQTYQLSCTGAAGITSSSVTVAIKPTVSLTATPAVVNDNTPTTLSWQSNNATSCTASGAWSGTLSPSGNKTSTALSSEKTFSIVCKGLGGSVSASVSVPVAPSLTFTATPSTIDYLGTSSLAWSSHNASACKAGGNWSGSKSVTGSQSTGLLKSNQNYQLTCSGTGGTITENVNVVVKPEISFSASANTVNYGSSSQLNWSSINADKCTASGAWSGSQALQGSLSTNALTSNQTFTLNCSNTAGSTSATVTIAVKPGINFTTTPSTVNYNDSTLLQWVANNALSCKASGAWSGNINLTDSKSINRLTSNKTYTITCSNKAGSYAVSQTVDVLPALIFTATPSTVANNGSTTLKWSTSYTTGCTASGAWSGNKATSGTFKTGKLTSNQSYNLSCKGLGGASSASVQVVVTRD